MWMEMSGKGTGRTSHQLQVHHQFASSRKCEYDRLKLRQVTSVIVWMDISGKRTGRTSHHCKSTTNLPAQGNVYLADLIMVYYFCHNVDGDVWQGHRKNLSSLQVHHQFASSRQCVFDRLNYGILLLS
jgi:hypothetical protein